jgi:carboxylesterase type B
LTLDTKPLITGNTDHEGGLWEAFAAAGKGGKSAKGPKDALSGALASFMDGDRSKLPPEIASMIPKDFDAKNMADSSSGCGSAKSAEVRVKAGVPAWRYRYMGVWPNTNLGPGTGAYHSSDVPLVFGTTELRGDNIKDSPEEAKVVKDTMTAWATFAKDPVKGLIGLGWPTYDSASKYFQGITYEGEVMRY